MDGLINQLSFLLTSPPGNITYYLVVGFSIAWTLQVAIARYSMRHSMHSRRLVWGLASMLAMRLVIFLTIFIAELGNTSLDFLPPADRAVSVISLIIIAWLWAYPERNRSADASGFLLSAVTIVFFIVSLAGWSGHDPAVYFNATLLGPLWETFALAVSAGGILLLLSRKPQNWEVGVWALGIQFVGSVSTLALPILQSNYTGFTRLSQMIAYPLLFTLTQYRHISSGQSDDIQEQLSTTVAPKSSGIPYAILVPLINDFLNLGKTSQEDRYDLLTRVISRICPKGMILILLPDDRAAHFSIGASHGINLPAETEALTAKSLPLISNALQRARTLSLPADNAAVDLATLKVLTNSERNYHVMACPLQGEKKAFQAGILIMRSEPRWTIDEQHLLNELIPAFEQIIQRTGKISPLDDEKMRSIFKQEEQITSLDKKLSKDELRATLAQIWTQNRQLRQTLTAVLENGSHGNHDFFPAIDALEILSKNIDLSALTREEAIEALGKALAQYRLDHETILQLVTEGKGNLLQADGEHQLQNILSKFQTQNQALLSDLKQSQKDNRQMKDLLKQAAPQKSNAAQAPAEVSPSMLDLQSSLAHAQAQNEERAKEIDRLQKTLKELQATFRTHLAQSEQKAVETRQRFMQISSQQGSDIAGAIQELQHPLATIVDYSDLVLDESVGSLGALQKKFLERIKEAVHQLEEQINQLLQTSIFDRSKIGLSEGLYDLNVIVEGAMSLVSAGLREKNIRLQQVLSPDLPYAQIDRDAAGEVLTILLRNAILATPANGKIDFTVDLKEENGQKKTLIQVSDSGEGIPQEDIPRIFSPVYRLNHTPIPGVGDTEISLSLAKTLVDALDGRIWVESASGKGTTYSVLLPLPNSLLLGEKQ